MKSILLFVLLIPLLEGSSDNILPIIEEKLYCDDSSSTGLFFDTETKKIISISSALIFGSSKIDVRNASIVAEENAKNQIIRWISQDIYTEIEIIDSSTTSETMIQSIDAQGNSNSSSKIQEEIKQTMNEFTRSTANEVLQRVQKIDERYNSDNTEVCVAISSGFLFKKDNQVK